MMPTTVTPPTPLNLPVVPKYTAADIESALRKKYQNYSSGYVLLDEVTLGDDEVNAASKAYYAAPWEDRMAKPQYILDLLEIAGGKSFRRIDYMLFKMRAGKYPMERTAIEVKVSRSDFFNDTAEKRRPFEQFCHRFVYCTPVGLIKKEEIPVGCGLLEYHGGYALGWTKRAPTHDAVREPDSDFWKYTLRRATWAEDDIISTKKTESILRRNYWDLHRKHLEITGENHLPSWS